MVKNTCFWSSLIWFGISSIVYSDAEDIFELDELPNTAGNTLDIHKMKASTTAVILNYYETIRKGRAV